MTKSKFQQENDALLNKLLSYYYNYWSKDIHQETSDEFKFGPTLELFITPTCNQQCGYCYLIKHSNELYPHKLNKPEIIINNLKVLLNYYLEQHFKIPRLDLFSGEIWGLELGNKIFDILLEYIQKGLNIKQILIPTNCSFILDKNLTKVMQFYINKFRDYNCSLILSASIDGKIVDNKIRPFSTKFEKAQNLKTDQFYEDLRKFCSRNNFGYHPMISAIDIENQIENYKWWENYLKAEEMPADWYRGILMLPVRDKNWTDEKILAYIKWLNFVIDYDVRLWKDPLEYFLRVFNFKLCSNIVKKDGTKFIPEITDGNWSPTWHYFDYSGSKITTMGCSAGRSLGIRLGDLAIYPCHRTAYDKFILGKYDIENNKIIGLTSQNSVLAFRTMGQGTKTDFKCDHCPIYSTCIKGCWGVNYETTGELFYAPEQVCNFYKAKTIFQYLKTHAFIDKYKLDAQIKITHLTIDSIFNNLKQQNEEEVQKWIALIQPLI